MTQQFKNIFFNHAKIFLFFWCLFWIVVYAANIVYPNNLPIWENNSAWGNFSNYIWNIVENCGTGKYIEWFSANGNPICKEKNIFPNITSLTSASIPVSTKNLNGAGEYINTLNKIFNTCWNGGYVVWFDSSTENMICKNKNGVIYKTNYSWVSNDFE